MFCGDCKYCDQYIRDKNTIYCKKLKTVVRQTNLYEDGKTLKAITSCKDKIEIN
jgi:hypothetical protein